MQAAFQVIMLVCTQVGNSILQVGERGIFALYNGATAGLGTGQNPSGGGMAKRDPKRGTEAWKRLFG
jgi:hypothetical protein